MAADREVVWLSALDGQPRRHQAEPDASWRDGGGTNHAGGTTHSGGTNHSGGTDRSGATNHSGGAGATTEPPAPFGWTDGLTETGGPRLWDRVVASEQARNARHERTSTVLLLEVVGFGNAVGRWGAALAVRQFVDVARVIAAEVRASDHCARIGPTRFGILLTETDEISAINCVDRIKARCDSEFDPAVHSLRVVGGWASPAVGGPLVDAHGLAEQRLEMALADEA